MIHSARAKCSAWQNQNKQLVIWVFVETYRVDEAPWRKLVGIAVAFYEDENLSRLSQHFSTGLSMTLLPALDALLQLPVQLLGAGHRGLKPK